MDTMLEYKKMYPNESLSIVSSGYTAGDDNVYAADVSKLTNTGDIKYLAIYGPDPVNLLLFPNVVYLYLSNQQTYVRHLPKTLETIILSHCYSNGFKLQYKSNVYKLIVKSSMSNYYGDLTNLYHKYMDDNIPWGQIIDKFLGTHSAPDYDTVYTRIDEFIRLFQCKRVIEFFVDDREAKKIKV